MPCELIKAEEQCKDSYYLKESLLSVLEGPWISMQANTVCSYRATELLYDGFILLSGFCFTNLSSRTH